MAKADYSYTIETVKGLKFICIIDQDLGGMSVTNCLEDVVAEIERKENINANECVVIYMDSGGVWDGWFNSMQSFFYINGSSKQDAIEKYIASFANL